MRKIDSKLIERFTKGDLVSLLDYIKSDNQLRLEVRQKGEAFIYYRKGKTLEVGSLKVDAKYGNVPATNLAVREPAKYFEQIKQSINGWLKTNNKNRAEFDTQQNIATSNQDKNDKYIIIDLEYAFEQNKIEKGNRKKRAVFDLLGIERKTERIIFFEVKTGLGATKGKAGINEHIKDFDTYINSTSSAVFRDNLIKDIKNIVDDKVKLGLISNFELSKSFPKNDPELIFVFHPDRECEIDQFKEELNGRNKLIVVSGKDYKLR